MSKPTGGYLFRLTRSILSRFNSPQSKEPEQAVDNSDVRVIGEDYLGNLYYERTIEGKRPRRWVLPIEEDDWDKPVPPEWEAWLRYRRNNPPTFDEINLNIAMAQLKKLRAQELLEKEKHLQLPQSSDASALVKNAEKSDEEKKQKPKWPTYPEYHP